MINFKKESYLKVLFVFCFTILATVYVIQYIFGYQPCNLCVIERIPYGLAIIILILNYKFKKNQVFFSVLLLLIFSFSFLISLYHLGIEQGLVNESNICASNNKGLTSKQEILNSFQEIEISCKDVAIRIFDLSLTTYNIMISILMFLISIKIFLINYGIKK